MINLCLDSISLLEKVKGQSIMSLVDKVSNILGDRKEEVVITPLLKNKSSTKDVDKGTDELVDMKKAVVTIHRKDSDKFEGQSKLSIG